jgi:hypothetical protein
MNRENTFFLRSPFILSYLILLFSVCTPIHLRLVRVCAFIFFRSIRSSIGHLYAFLLYSASPFLLSITVTICNFESLVLY